MLKKVVAFFLLLTTLLAGASVSSLLQQTPIVLADQNYVNFSTDFTTYVDNAVQAVRDCYHIPGLAVAVIDRRETSADNNNTVKRFVQGYGVRDTQLNTPVDENTRFAIGSITKSFTAATFASLKSGGTPVGNASLPFDYDTTILSVLKNVYGIDAFNADPQVNMYANFRDLLAHRTGILSPAATSVLGTDLSPSDLIQNINRLPAVPHANGGGFRESFLYNNWMFALVGALMANATGVPYETLVRQTILQPWGINGRFLSEIDEVDVDGDNIALPNFLYANESGDGKFDYYFKQYDLQWLRQWEGSQGVMNPAGAMTLSALDMARYIEFWISGGYGTIQPSAYVEVNNPQTQAYGNVGARPPNVTYWDSDEYYTAFALYRGLHNDSIKFKHVGDVGTFLSSMTVFMAPEPQYGLFISTNGPRAPLAAYGVTLLEQALLEAVQTDGHPVNWPVQKLCFPIEPSSFIPHLVPLDTNGAIGNASMYEGDYSDPILGTVTITAYNASHLRWELGPMGSGYLAPDASASSAWKFLLNFDGDVDWVQNGLEIVSAQPPNQSVTFIPDSSSDYYRPCTAVILEFERTWTAGDGPYWNPIFVRVAE